MLIRKRTVIAFEKAIAIVGILLFTTALSNPLLFQALSIPSKISTLIRYGILLPALLSLFQQPKKHLQKAFFKGLGAWSLTSFLTLSFLWSPVPSLVIAGVRAEILPMSLYSFYFATRFSLKEQLQLLSKALAISNIFSLFVIILLPAVGRHSPLEGEYANAWRGVYVHKNLFGAYLTISIMLAFASAICAKKGEKDWSQKWVYVGFYFFMILCSSSASAFVYSTGLMSLLFLYRRFRVRGKRTLLLGILSLFLAIAVGVFVSVAWVPLLSALGRDPTLSARTEIWTFLLNEKIPQHPLLGYGRGVFWRDGHLFDGIYQAAGHVPPHAHDGFIDLLLDGGMMGLTLFIFSFAIVYTRALREAYRAQDPESLWPLIGLTLVIIYNITESLLTRGDNLIWCFYLITSSIPDLGGKKRLSQSRRG
jgi:O-antigen ligase